MKVGIVNSSECAQLACTSPKFADRYALVIGLIHSYGLFRNLLQIPPLCFTSMAEVYKALAAFHSTDYIDALYQLQSWYAADPEPRLSQEEEDLLDSYGLSYDCPGFPHVFDYALAAVRCSLAAAMALTRGDCRVALNWIGGWHHAKRSEASGFCYLNDIVLAIDHLRSYPSPQPNVSNARATSDRVLYVDFDLHHADGVEQAFWYSSRVVTFSVHHASPGFFPGTGTATAVPNSSTHSAASSHFPNGAGRGQFGAFNLPLAEGADDITWLRAVLPVLDMLHAVVQPAYVVVQCGADCLSTDPHAVFNLTNLSTTETTPALMTETTEQREEDWQMQDEEDRSVTVLSGYLEACKCILSWELPTLFVGGGGYNLPDTARLWTRLTALIVEQVEQISLNLSSEIPDHCFLDRYGPDFDLDISSVPRTNRVQPRDIQQHHKRLFQQACDYANLNSLEFDRGLYRDKLCKSDGNNMDDDDDSKH